MTTDTAATWPALTGTDKQIPWATTLRTQAIADMRTKLQAGLPTDTAQAVHAIWTAAALRQTDAGWWIDNRGNLIYAIKVEVLTDDERATMITLMKEAQQ